MAHWRDESDGAKHVWDRTRVSAVSHGTTSKTDISPYRVGDTFLCISKTSCNAVVTTRWWRGWGCVLWGSNETQVHRERRYNKRALPVAAETCVRFRNISRSSSYCGPDCWLTAWLQCHLHYRSVRKPCVVRSATLTLVFNPSEPAGYCTNARFSITKYLRSAHTVFACFVRTRELRLFHYTALTCCFV